MIDFKQFTKDAAVHYHLTEAFANYAYWLSSDVESYFDSLVGNPLEAFSEFFKESITPLRLMSCLA